MSLLANLQANDPIPTNPVPSFLNNSAVVNQTGQQVLNNPLQGNTGVFSNFGAPHRSFLDSLSEYTASIPIKSFWVVQFNIPQLISEDIMKSYSEEFINNDVAKVELTNNKFIRNIGVIFCRSFNFTGESNNSAVPEMDIRGFRSVPYAGGRSSNIFSSLNLSFYESSVSFIDHIIRPWVILMSYYTTIARNDAITQNNLIADLKQDITCHLMTRTGVGTVSNNRGSSSIPNYNNPVAVRKTIIFKNCFPKDMGTLEYAQQDSNSVETVSTTFCYTNYEVAHAPYRIGLPELPAQITPNLQNFSNLV
jgi:hypothetical protein